MGLWFPPTDAPSAPPGLSAAYIAGLIGRANLDQILTTLEKVDGAARSHEIIDYVTAWKVLNANIETIADEGHRLGNAAIPTGNFELLIASMVQGQSLADGLVRMAAGARILRPDLEVRAAIRLGQVHLTIRFVAGETLPQAIYLEALVTVVHCTVRWGIERAAAPLRVRGPPIVDPEGGSWLDLLGAPVQRHGEGVTVVYPADISAAPFRQHAFGRWHDAAFQEYLRLITALERSAAAPGTPVARQVREALMSGAACQGDVAARLAMSVPSLRRRLTEEGESFRAVQAGLRREAAQILLLGDKSVEKIATELGLSDSRCFRRACKTWFGGSPSAVRSALRRSPVAGSTDTSANKPAAG